MATPSRRSFRGRPKSRLQSWAIGAPKVVVWIVDNSFLHLGDIGALANVRFAPIVLKKSSAQLFVILQGIWRA
jgi:hypothetical protein